MDAAAPGRRELWQIALFAVALRAAVFLTARYHGHLSMDGFNSLGDTKSYTAWAAVMTGDRPLAALSAYDRRVFPGYPVLIAAVHLLRVPLPLAAALVTWFSAGIAAAVSAKVFADARVGWAMTCLIPHYLINSTLGMSEAPVLAVTVVALLAGTDGRIILSGLLFGFAGLIRPVACFAAAGAVLMLWRENRTRRAVLLGVIAAATVGAGILALQLWTGDAMAGPRTYANHPDAYAGHMIEWPLQAMITVPSMERTPRWRIAYNWAHVVLVTFGSVLLGMRAARDRKPDPRDSAALPWLAGNSLFSTCVGAPWGFRHFPRFTIPASPALFWAVRKWLPRRAIWWVLIAAALFWKSVQGVLGGKGLAPAA
jgi:hypothetical protein